MHSPVCRSLRGPWALLGSAITNTPQGGGTPAGPTLPPTRCHTHRSTPAAPNETQTDLTFCQSVPVAFPTAPRVGYQLPSQTRGAAGDLGARVMSWNSGCHGGERGAAASSCLTWGPPELSAQTVKNGEPDGLVLFFSYQLLGFCASSTLTPLLDPGQLPPQGSWAAISWGPSLDSPACPHPE